MTERIPTPSQRLETIDEALAAIPTMEELEDWFYRRTPPRWEKFGLEWMHKVKTLAEAGLSASSETTATSSYNAGQPAVYLPSAIETPSCPRCGYPEDR